jgi:hypothetical protein
VPTGRELSERRRSNAAGTHGKKSKDRANTEREALEQEQTDQEETDMLTITTKNGTTYPVEGMEVKNGMLKLKARQPSGKLRWINTADVTTGEFHRVMTVLLDRGRAERKAAESAGNR